MTKATRVTVSTFGAIAGLAGLEHGIGEALQGNTAPNGMMILSWPDSEWYAILGGEPAMTIIPNLLVTGVLAILVSLVFLCWVTMFIQSKNGGPVLLLLSLVLLLVGGGFGPPLLGLILGVAATRINSHFTWWRAHLSPGAHHILGALWPWSFAAGLAAWLFLFPGTILVDHYFGVSDPGIMVAITVLSAFTLLLLSIFSALAFDAQRQPALYSTQ
ncbi:MAG: hypothetical protein ACYC4L_10840 [Chloroflexota bacterium]